VREAVIATQRTTFEKQNRERAKKAKAAAKRERRLDRAAEKAQDDGGDGGGAAVTTDSADDLLRQIEALHQDFDAKQIDFETFEERKVDLFERLAALDI
jgi:molybdenum-dependent DNA-binding transcriptional regulator ModE